MGLLTPWTVATLLPESASTGHGVVPAGIAYLDSVDCWAQHADVTPACRGPITGNRDDVVEARTAAGIYNPVYYAVAGLPSRPSGAPGVV